MTRSSSPLPPEKARASQPQLPDAGEPSPEVIRLANRTTLFTFFAAFATVLGIVLLPRVLEGPIWARLAAALPLLAAAGAILHVRRLRSALRRPRPG